MTSTGSERPTQRRAAGGSARAEYARSRARDSELLRQARPTIVATGLAAAAVGLVLTAFGPTPTGGPELIYRIAYFSIVVAACAATATALIAIPASTDAWRIGAEGEEWIGEVLRPLESQGFFILHDRSMPRSRANIDHIVVGPPGVFVVETKHYTGKLSERRKRDFVAQAKREAAAVAIVVSPVPVTPFVCILEEVDLGWFTQEVDGVRIVWPHQLATELRYAPIRLTSDQVHWLADRIDRSILGRSASDSSSLASRPS